MKREFVSMNFLVFIAFVFVGFVSISAGENVKKSIDENRDDNGETNYESKDESLDIPLESESSVNATCTRRQNSQMHEIRSAQLKQFPFMAAIMSQQNEYLCSGCMISSGLVLTTGTCTTLPLSYVLLNTTTDKKDENSVSLHVIKTDRFPTFVAAEGSKDVGVIYTEKHKNNIASKIKLSNYTNPRIVVDVEAIGFGLNADIGQVRELQYIGMEVRYAAEVAESVKAYFDCVETKVNTCFKDTGGPIIYDNELVGIVTRGQPECTKEMSATYAVNKRMVDFLPTYVFKAWLDEKIKKIEDQDATMSLATYPARPETAPQMAHKMVSDDYDDFRSGSSGSTINGIPLFISSGIVYLKTMH